MSCPTWEILRNVSLGSGCWKSMKTRSLHPNPLAICKFSVLSRFITTTSMVFILNTKSWEREREKEYKKGNMTPEFYNLLVNFKWNHWFVTLYLTIYQHQVKVNHLYQHLNDWKVTNLWWQWIFNYILQCNMTYFKNTANKPIYSEIRRYLSNECIRICWH